MWQLWWSALIILLLSNCTRVVYKDNIVHKTDSVYIQQHGSASTNFNRADSIIVERLVRDTLREQIRVYRPQSIRTDTAWQTSVVHVTDTIYIHSEPIIQKGAIEKSIDWFMQICIVCIVLIIIWAIYKIRR